jgi:hypothetical protein
MVIRTCKKCGHTVVFPVIPGALAGILVKFQDAWNTLVEHNLEV